MHKVLHLFRHGQTDWNTQGLLQGHTDIPLNEEGRLQAQSLRDYFAANPVDLFLSSDLIRAQETARIANSSNKPLTLTPLLREACMGELEGRKRDEVPVLFGASAWEQWTSFDPQHQHFCFPKAESSFRTISRMKDVLENFCRQIDFREAAISTHGLTLRRFLHHLAPEMQEPLPVPNCVVYRITWDGAGQRFHFSAPFRPHSLHKELK